MDQHAGRVDHSGVGGRGAAGEPFERVADDRRRLRHPVANGEALPRSRHRLAHGFPCREATIAGDGFRHFGIVEDPVYRGQPGERAHADILRLGGAWTPATNSRAGGVVYPFCVSSPAEIVNQLHRWLDELSRKWERFFVHDPQVPLPPERERAALERQLREISRAEFRQTQRNSSVSTSSCIAFATYNTLWQRQLREREEARQAGRAAVAASAANAPAPAAVDVANGDEFSALHARYLEELQASGATASVNFERFRQTLETQKRLLEERGVTVEGFDVVREGAQVKLKARVRRRASS